MNHNDQEKQALMALDTAAAPARTATSAVALVMDAASMDKMLRIAEVMASGKSTLPAHLRGNVGDCMAVVMQAVQWGMNPYAVGQKTHIVNSTLGYEAQLVAAVINNSGAVQDRFHFEWFGPWEKVIGKFEIRKGEKGEYRIPGWKLADEEGIGIKVWATLKGEAEPRVLELLLAQARTRNSTLWADDPKQQLAYLAQKRWARLYAPDVILGVYTPDEFDQSLPRDMGPADVVKPEKKTNAADDALLGAAQTAAGKGMAAYQAFWSGLSTDQRKSLAGDHADLKETATAYDKSRTVETAPAPAPTAAPPADDRPAVTFDGLMAKLNAAQNEDAMYVVMDWANELTDQGQIKAMEDRFNARLLEMRGGQA